MNSFKMADIREGDCGSYAEAVSIHTTEIQQKERSNYKYNQMASSLDCFVQTFLICTSFVDSIQMKPLVSYLLLAQGHALLVVGKSLVTGRVMRKRILVNALSETFHLVRAFLDFIVITSNLIATGAFLEIRVQGCAWSITELLALLSRTTTSRDVRTVVSFFKGRHGVLSCCCCCCCYGVV